ncbi:hypothetical protein FRAAL4550 [Frankia alni ACN14a]|uniref:Uncharacterized protein n=1 Tax=Frankia alni (strain DSM 45986 / CECT 9034 / ACN14a) TaxID=326424 RepID=Q0RH41_FRAAA|nr:hypothetical protein FRAAL4550 [Frankia alni ACN14a]
MAPPAGPLPRVRDRLAALTTHAGRQRHRRHTYRQHTPGDVVCGDVTRQICHTCLAWWRHAHFRPRVTA